jgi:Uma2 family endonuclease
MSMPAAHDLCLTVDEYLQLEETARERHEYVAGRIFVMVGANVAHNTIVSNLNYLFYAAVRQSGCRIFSTDMKLWIETSQSFYYPDLIVTCESLEAKSTYVEAPCLLVEVLSPSTGDIDKREKLIAYRHLPSLIEYLLVYQEKAQIEVYRKDDKGNWHSMVFNGGIRIQLLSLPQAPFELEMNEVYSGVDLAE